MNVPEGVLAGAHAVQQGTPGLPLVRLADEGCPPADRFRCIRAQAGAELGEGKGAVRLLPEDADAGEGAQQPVQRLGWLSVAAARSSLVRGPSLRRSARPSTAATWMAWVTWKPLTKRRRAKDGR